MVSDLAHLGYSIDKYRLSNQCLPRNLSLRTHRVLYGVYKSQYSLFFFYKLDGLTTKQPTREPEIDSMPPSWRVTS